MKKTIIGLGLLLCLSDLPALARENPEQIKRNLAVFLDEWHDDAAHARLAYFDKIAVDGVYIGTDKTERWSRDAFKVWAQRYFERPVAWAFTATQRHIAMSADQSMLWFDEQLSTQMGLCQASGVVRKTDKGFEIVHYQLSIAVPNEATKAVIAEIQKVEQAAPAKNHQ